MKKKMFLTSAIAMGFVAPAFAAMTDSNTFPDASQGEYMQANTRYIGAATADNMDSVYEGSVNAVAEYEDIFYDIVAGNYLAAGSDDEDGTICPAGSYCSGLTHAPYNATSAQGIETCPTIGGTAFTSDAGSSAVTSCYQENSAMSTATLNPFTTAHLNTSKNTDGYINGVKYKSATTAARRYATTATTAGEWAALDPSDLEIEDLACENGYHKYDPYAPTYEELITYIMGIDGLEESEAKAEYPTYAAAKNYLVEEADEWGGVVFNIVYPKKYGQSANENLKSKVSSADYTIDGTGYGYTRLNGNAGSKESEYGLTQGSGEWATTFEYGVIRGTAKCTATDGEWGTQGNPDATTSGEARYCWCQGTGIKGTNGTLQSLASSWVFSSVGGFASFCADNCANDCAGIVQDSGVFRAALFGSAGASAALCEANTITINWSNADAEDISANNAGTATYGEDVRTPVKAETIKGKTFKGWKFSKPTTTQLPE